jgi:hypothetical protein
MAASNQIFLVMDAGTPVAAFTARPELKAYLRRRLDDAVDHDHFGHAGGMMRRTLRT